jgi:6-phospho-beta-glucosidase
MTRVAVLGGSSVSTPQLAEGLARWAGREGRPVELVLVGRSAERLRAVAAAGARAVAALEASPPVALRTSTSVEEGIQGADVVINQVRVGGLQARAFDERYPRDLEVPGEETMGPGGFANAWRTLPVVRELFELCRRVAPGALVINLTNPAGMVQQVAERVVGCPHVVTVCDSPVSLATSVARLAGVEGEGVDAGYVGMNHFGWLTSLRRDGRDLLAAALRDHSEEVARQAGIDPGIVRWLGAAPNPYLRYVYQPGRQLALQRAKDLTRAEELLALETEALGVYGSDDGDPAQVAARRRAPWYTLCVVPLVAARVEQRSIVLPVSTLNRGHLSFLPDDVAIEVTARVHWRGTPEPLTTGPLPPDSRALLVANATYERLTVDAVLGGDREAAVRALAANPVVPSVDVAASAVAAIEARFGAPGASAP